MAMDQRENPYKPQVLAYFFLMPRGCFGYTFWTQTRQNHMVMWPDRSLSLSVVSWRPPASSAIRRTSWSQRPRRPTWGEPRRGETLSSKIKTSGLLCFSKFSSGFLVVLVVILDFQCEQRGLYSYGRTSQVASCEHSQVVGINFKYQK